MAITYGVWTVLVTLALIHTLIWAVGELRIPYASSTSAALWGVLAYQSQGITHYTGTGSPVSETVGYPSVQLVFLFLALVSGAAFALNIVGDWPQDEDETADETTSRQDRDAETPRAPARSD